MALKIDWIIGSELGGNWDAMFGEPNDAPIGTSTPCAFCCVEVGGGLGIGPSGEDITVDVEE